MSVIDIIIPTYRGIATEAHSPLIAMMQATECNCRAPNGAPIHPSWKCPNGRHSVRLLPPVYCSSVVHWARNQSVAQAMFGQPAGERPLSEYILCMDDDMVVEPDYLKRMLSYKVDIVCGICTIRRDPPIPNIRFWSAEQGKFNYPIEWDWESQKLIEIDAAGAAFMLVKRKVFERLGEAYLNSEFERAEDRRKMAICPGDLETYWDAKSAMRRARFEAAVEAKDWRNADCWWFQFLDNGFDEQQGEFGEDVSFCWKAKQLGFKIFADPQVLPGHLGIYGYSIRDYRAQVEAAKEAGAVPRLVDNRVGLGV